MASDAPAAFFSYCRDDSEFALRLAEDLKAAGAPVWMDQLDIEGGQEWDSAVEDAVTRCPRMLLILSPASVKSKNVRNEIAFALDVGKTVIPVLYQDCAVPLQLRRIQHIDFRADYTRGLKALLKTLGVQPPLESRAPASSGVKATSGSRVSEVKKRETEAAKKKSRENEQRKKSRDKASAEAEAHFERGKGAYDANDPDEAILEFREAIRLQPDHGDAHLALGYALTAKRDLDGAMNAHREALRLMPYSPEARLGLGAALFQSGELDEATVHFRQTVRLKPDLADARVALASALLTANDLEGAMAEFRKVVRLAPDSAPGHLGLALILNAKGNDDEARREIRHAYELDPNDRNIRKLHEKLLKGEESKVEVQPIARAEAAAESQRRAPQADAEVDAQAEAHYQRGRAASQRDDMDAGIAEFRQALRLKPDYAEARIVLGFALVAKSDLDGAEKEFREVIRLQPGSARGHMGLGAVLGAKGEEEHALREVRRAHELDPNDPYVHKAYKAFVEGKTGEREKQPTDAEAEADAHFKRGSAALDNGDLDEGIAAFRVGLRLRPDYADAHCMLGLALLGKGETDSAMAEIREALRLSPELPSGHLFLGLAFKSTGDDHQALGEFRRAYELDANDPKICQAYESVAQDLLSRGRLDEAVAEFGEMVRLNPASAHGHVGLGVALWQKGNQKLAVQEIRRAYQIDPKDETVCYAYENLIGHPPTGSGAKK